MSSLRIGSINVQGFKSSEDYVAELFDEMDFLGIQKHWLNPAELTLFSSVSEDIAYVTKSPMEADQIRSGRPFGVVALLWHKRHQHAVFPIDTVSDRIIAVRVNSSLGSILVIVVYLPVDYGDSDALDVYVSELGFLEGILDNESYDHVIVMGDLNTDLRHGDRFASRLTHFLREYNLEVAGLDDIDTNSRYTWHSHDFQHGSWIDHICLSTSLNALLETFGIRDGDCLVSDHWAIAASLSVVIDTKVSSESCCGYRRRLQWKEATTADLRKYKERVEMEMESIVVPAEAAVCNDPLSCQHRQVIQSFYDSVTVAMIKSAKRSIPKGRPLRVKKMGWNENLQQLKQAAVDDYTTWKVTGKPRHGDLYRRMLESRKKFKKALKAFKRQENEIWRGSL